MRVSYAQRVLSLRCGTPTVLGGCHVGSARDFALHFGRLALILKSFQGEWQFPFLDRGLNAESLWSLLVVPSAGQYRYPL